MSKRGSNFFFGGLIFFIVAVIATGCSKTQTSSEKPLPDSAFRANLVIENPPVSLKAKSTSKVEVKVTNSSSTLWPSKMKSDATFLIDLSYHWLDKNGKMLIHDGTRTTFPHDLGPNDTITLEAAVTAPDSPGEYILEFDLVQEAVSWFKDKGSKTATINVNVQ